MVDRDVDDGNANGPLDVLGQNFNWRMQILRLIHIKVISTLCSRKPSIGCGNSTWQRQ